MKRVSIGYVAAAILATACAAGPGDEVSPSNVTTDMLYGFWVNELDGVRTVLQFVAEDGYYVETRGLRDVSFVHRSHHRSDYAVQLASTFAVKDGFLKETVVADVAGLGGGAAQFATEILEFRLDEEMVIASTRTESGRAVYRKAATCPTVDQHSGWNASRMKPAHDAHYFDGYDAVTLESDGTVHAIASSTGSCGVGCPRPPSPAYYVSNRNTCGVRTHAIAADQVFPYNPVLRLDGSTLHAVWNDVNGKLTYGTRPIDDNRRPSVPFALEVVQQLDSAAREPLFQLLGAGVPVVGVAGQTRLYVKSESTWREVSVDAGAGPLVVNGLARHPSGAVWVYAGSGAQAALLELGTDGTLAPAGISAPELSGTIQFLLDKDGQPAFVTEGSIYPYASGSMTATSDLALVRRAGDEWSTLPLGQGVVPVVAVDDRGRIVVVSRWDNYRNSAVPVVSIVDGDQISRWRPWEGVSLNAPGASDLWAWSPLDVAVAPGGVVAITGGGREQVMLRPRDEQFAPATSTVRVVFEGDGGGTVKLGDKSCSADCELTLPVGLQLTLEATPDASSTFTFAQPCLPSKPDVCHVVVTHQEAESMSISVTFTK